jgi:hypothetical protein
MHALARWRALPDPKPPHGLEPYVPPEREPTTPCACPACGRANDVRAVVHILAHYRVLGVSATTGEIVADIDGAEMHWDVTSPVTDAAGHVRLHCGECGAAWTAPAPLAGDWQAWWNSPWTGCLIARPRIYKRT